MSGKISGIYVEIKGDASQLKKELKDARQLITEQAHGMSNALANALSPAQIKKSTNALLYDLNALANASKLTGKEFGSLGVDLGKLRSLTGLSEAEFGKLQSRMLQTSAANAQEKALRNIAKAASLSASEVERLGRQMGVSQSGIAAVSEAASSASSSMTLFGAAARTALAYLSVQTFFQFGKAVLDAGIALDSLQRSFVAITGTQAGAAEMMGWLRDEAGRLGQNLYELAPAFKSLSAAARGTTLEGEETRKIFSAVTAASTALGLSADQTKGTLLALEQMISKGTVSMEELRRQLGDRLPGAFGLAAKAMGVSTQELNKMVAEGKVMADDLLPKLAAELEKTYGQAAQTAALESAQAAVNRLSQEWTDLKNNMFESDSAVAGTNMMTEALRGLNQVVTAIRTGKNASGEVRTIFDGLGRGDMTGVEGYNSYRGKVAPVDSLSRVRVADPRITGDQFIMMQNGMGRAAKFAAELTAEVDKGREAYTKYTQSAREKAKADFDAAYRFANTTEEQSKALKVYQEAIAAIDKRDAGSGSKALESSMARINSDIAKLSMSAADFELYQIDQEFAKLAKEIGAANPQLQRWVELRREEAELTRTKSVNKELEDYFAAIDKQYADLLKKAEDDKKENEEILLDFSDRYRAIVVGETEFKKEEIDKQAAIFRAAGADEIAVAQWVAQEKLAVSRDWQDGATRALQAYTDSATNAAQLVEGAITSGFGSMTDALVDFAVTGKGSFTDFADSVIRDMMRIMIQQSITGPLASGMSSAISGWLSAGSGPSVASVGAPKVGYAKGGVPGAPSLHAYANSVVDSPTIFPFARGIGLMGEAGPEAIMPLKRGPDGTLGVRGGGVNIVVNNNAPGTQAKAQVNDDGRGGKSIEILVDEMVSANLSRHGSSSDRSLRRNYNVSQSLARR